ncbi:hypothetical protein ILYODFUR_035473 [Ilyodon furcidens]|uniref:Uncharacterized protein n=1 Tax=Ilyodon furcidens TaxID=33524 RepID=A0ABV0V1P3_9TELE
MPTRDQYRINTSMMRSTRWFQILFNMSTKLNQWSSFSPCCSGRDVQKQLRKEEEILKPDRDTETKVSGFSVKNQEYSGHLQHEQMFFFHSVIGDQRLVLAHCY